MAENKISCIRLLPFRAFANGTWGSILVIDWTTNTPSVFLFNSPERKKEAPNTARNYLLPEEEEKYLLYKKDGEGIGQTASEAYSQYGVVRLVGGLLSAHIADLVCKNLNEHNPANRHKTDRADRLLLAAKLHGTADVYQAELTRHQDRSTLWERTILEQTLPLIAPGYNHPEWLETIEKMLEHISADTQSHQRKEDKAILAVLASDICQSKSDWGAVFKILSERKLIACTSYLAGARVINRVCGKEVTTAAAIKQSPALTILAGTAAKGWTDKMHNRQSSNLLIHYREIADLFLKNCY